MVWAAWAPDCMATSARAGRSSSAIRSPTTNTSGWEAREQSGWTLTRPPLSTSAPARSASVLPRPTALVPAAHTLVAVSMRSVEPSRLVITTHWSSMSVTIAPKWISTPMRSRSRAVIRESRWPMDATRPSPPSTSTTRVLWVSMRR